MAQLKRIRRSPAPPTPMGWTRWCVSEWSLAHIEIERKELAVWSEGHASPGSSSSRHSTASSS
jgi:hypothetical protein